MTLSQVQNYGPGIVVTAPISSDFAEILTPAALNFVATLARACTATRAELLQRRQQRQQRIDAGEQPDFLPDTIDIREGDWTIAPVPADLLDRRVEITGPVDRKMIINALNSGAKVFMADFEDANAPNWENTIRGQINLRDAIAGSIDFVSPEGKAYRLKPTIATLMVRPRGWHLHDKHVLIDDQPVPGGVLDFGLFMFHNARALIEKGSGPYFYLPKLESHREARLWNDLFVLAQQELGIPRGTIKATVLIETILAAFEMNEILYELREHSAGLNCGRWDYIFSYIKKFRNQPQCILPDRAQVTMTTHFMRSYSLLAIQTCHRRKAHAVGGMSAFIPVKSDPEANERAFEQVRADKQREATDGHDGTWVAHPGLVPVALEVFDRVMPQPHQIDKRREDPHISAADLLQVPEGTITEAGLRTNVSVGVQYLAAWLDGAGAVPINNLMEDAATCEISRAQLWQWIRHPKGVLTDGRTVTIELFRQVLAEELNQIRAQVGDEQFQQRKYQLAGQLFDSITTDDQFVEFLTLPAYQYLD
jgi:malate synthase